MMWRKDEYWLTDETEKLDVDCVHAWLVSTYWAGRRTRETVEKSMRHSLCFGLFHEKAPVALERGVHAASARKGQEAREFPRPQLAEPNRSALQGALPQADRQFQSHPIGFARVVTDRSTHGYLCDVFVVEEYRGRGLGQWMLECIVDHPDLRTVRMDLFTRDAQEFYRRIGFAKHRYECLVRYPEHYAGGSDSSTDS